MASRSVDAQHHVIQGLGLRFEGFGIMVAIELRRWLDRLLPAVCVVCGDPLAEGEGRACEVCWARAPVQRYPRCSRCGIALADVGTPALGSACTDCQDWLPYLREARSPCAMSGTAAAIVHALKYGGWRQLAEEMAERMAAIRFSPGVEAEISGVVAVPLSAARLRERGFNQSELLARGLAQLRSWPLLPNSLQRVRDTRRQARLSMNERAPNVAGAFAAYPTGGGVEDAHLLLVDDVLTTGHTAAECVRALCLAGARAVSVIAFARARPDLMGG